MKPFSRTIALVALLSFAALAADTVKTVNGVLEGTADPSSGVRMFKGIPFAAPPVGDLRWKAPQPVVNWSGVRQAVQFGPRCMQRSMFSDMVFRSNGMGEDCLYLNVWTPAKSAREKLPVLVYFYGGGYMGGDGSEFRYDGGSIARKGIVALTVNYRLGVFGFFAHPELSQEAPYHGSGNYGLLDQTAALRWVRDNIASFGGDPKRVTIAGESAGSISVSAQMTSPLAKNLIAGAIGSSGAMINPTLPPVPLAEGEQAGIKFAAAVGAASLAALRAMPATDLLDVTAKPGLPRFSATVDGYLFPKPPVEILAAGEQAHVPLLVGWNSEEQGWRRLIPKGEATPENFATAVKAIYGDRAGEVLKVFPASTPEEALASATALSGDRFTAFSSWKWFDLHVKTGGKPVYRYFYTHPRPAMVAPPPNAPPPARGAVHSAEIEYAMGNLATNKVYAWTPDDYKLSQIFESYYANFVKTGNPNGPGLPKWPVVKSGGPVQILRLDVSPQVEPDRLGDRYKLLDQLFAAPAK